MTDDEYYEKLWDRTLGTLHGCIGGFVIFVIGVLCMLLFTCCKQTEDVLVEKVRTDTLVKTNHVRDSIWLHDSTVVSSVGDTVFVDRWHNKFVRNEVHDTVYKARVDSIPKPYPVTEYVEKDLTAWQRIRLGIGNVVLVLMLIAVGWWVGKKLKK